MQINVSTPRIVERSALFRARSRQTRLSCVQSRRMIFFFAEDFGFCFRSAAVFSAALRAGCSVLVSDA